MTDDAKRIVETMKHCADINACLNCHANPHKNGESAEFGMPPKCLVGVMKEAAAMIVRMNAELDELRDANRMHAELEAAKRDMKLMAQSSNACDICKNNMRDVECEAVYECRRCEKVECKCYDCTGYSHFEWRGLCDQNGGEHADRST